MERPILFNTPMVQAILEGRKTQTRRVLKVQPPLTDKKIMPLYTMEPEPKVTEVTMHEVMGNGMPFPSSISRHKCPYGKIGDLLWVRETFCYGCIDEWDAEHPDDRKLFVDQYDGRKQAPIPKQWCLENNVEIDDVIWKPSIHMPRSASRILLEITNIRVEQLNQISRVDAVKEGLHQLPATGRYVVNKGDQYFGGASSNPCEVFKWLWESINGADSWAINPWVWVVEFKVKDPQQ